MNATLDDYRWLVSEAATPWLDFAQQFASTGNPVHTAKLAGVSTALLSRLRRDLSPERAALVAEQIGLRRRAREKFSLSDQMFFTRKGLEQATDEQLAAYKAGRFPADRANADLCCGIGGDLLALARRGSVRGVDLDPIADLLATANARAHGYSEDRCSVRVEDVAQFDVQSCGAWHCDPDRRPEGHRTSQAAFAQPSPEVIDRLLAANPHAAIKLAPAADAPAHWNASAWREWLGSRGECRQQVVWFGDLARHPGQRAATVAARQGQTRTVAGDDCGDLPVAGALRKYLFEPHAAVLAAKLTGVVCRELDLAAVSAGIVYLTGDHPLNDLVLDVFEIRDVLPFDRKRLKGYCRERNIGRFEVKKRGVDIDPEQLRKDLAQRGEAAATIILTPVAGQVKAIVAQRFSFSST